MKTELRNVYSCDHCSKKYVNIGHAQRHEKTCKRNPENDRACFGCKHLKEATYSVGFEFYNGTAFEDRKVLRCELLDKYVYPPSVERSDRGGYELVNDTNEPMPRVCESKPKDLIDEFDFCAIEVQRQIAKRNTDIA